MSMDRRESLKLMALASVALAVPGCARSDVEHAALHAADRVARQLPDVDRAPTTLTPAEYRTVEVLVDWIIPADDRSGSATDAGVPAFIDFMLEDAPDLAVPVRGGLGWLNAETTRRTGVLFADAATADQQALLDEIAWPEVAAPEMEPGVRFFTLMRDLTASGFFSSKIGFEDLGYLGNRPQGGWDGCPPEAHEHLGLDTP